MVAGEKVMLPLHELLTQLQAWLSDRSDTRRDAVRDSLERLAASYQARGAFLVVEIAPIGPLSIGAGSLRGLEAAPASDGPSRRTLAVGIDHAATATLWVDGPDAADDLLADAVELALSAAWAQHETVSQRQQLEALDAALSGIATIASVDRVLQLIVDR